MKNIVFFLTLTSLGAGALFSNLTPSLTVNAQGNVRRVAPIGVTESDNLTSCLARQDVVKQRMTSLVSLSVNMEGNFDKISQRAINYYNTTVVPTGATVPNFSTLVANIQTNKNTIQAAITVSQTNINNFSCKTGNPKLLITQFRVNMQAVKIDLRNYRASIRTLIVAIHNVSPETVKNVEINK